MMTKRQITTVIVVVAIIITGFFSGRFLFYNKVNVDNLNVAAETARVQVSSVISKV